MTLPSTPAGGHILQVETGLQQLMGDRALYMQILRRFRQRYPDSASQARVALTAGELPIARSIFHTLKGAAGMVGAQQVYLLAADLEVLPASDAGQFTAPLAQLEQALRNLMSTIDSTLAASADEEAVPAVAPAAVIDTVGKTADAHAAQARTLVRHLARLLEEGDGAAIDVLEQSATVLASSLGVAVFQEVTEAAHQFDFEAALATLQAAGI